MRFIEIQHEFAILTGLQMSEISRSHWRFELAVACKIKCSCIQAQCIAQDLAVIFSFESVLLLLSIEFALAFWWCLVNKFKSCDRSRALDRSEKAEKLLDMCGSR